jgi:hypothetical protein
MRSSPKRRESWETVMKLRKCKTRWTHTGTYPELQVSRQTHAKGGTVSAIRTQGIPREDQTAVVGNLVNQLNLGQAHRGEFQSLYCMRHSSDTIPTFTVPVTFYTFNSEYIYIYFKFV